MFYIIHTHTHTHTHTHLVVGPLEEIGIRDFAASTQLWDVLKSQFLIRKSQFLILKSQLLIVFPIHNDDRADEKLSYI